MRWTHSACILLTIVMVAGCSSSENAEGDESSKKVSDASALSLPTIAELKEAVDPQNNAGEIVTPFAENLNFFTAPKTFIPDEPEDIDIDPTGELPPLRLVGFVGAAGDKAMVAVDGKMHIVMAGKRLKGIEIVSVESPNVGLRWGATELTINFYEPSKANRRPRKAAAPAFTFSPELPKIGSRPNNPNPLKPPAKATRKPPAKATPAPPRPQIVVPPLPTVATPDTSSGDSLLDFPDLGAPRGVLPAP